MASGSKGRGKFVKHRENRGALKAGSYIRPVPRISTKQQQKKRFKVRK